MKASNRSALVGLTMAFFVVGFMSAFNDILMPHFKFLFHLDYFKMTLVSFSFFIAYGIFSIPMSILTASIGYKNGILVGFILNLLGVLLIIHSIMMGSYYVFLMALFVLAAGVVLILVSAMPFSLLLGKEKTASSRVTFMEMFHSLGSMVAPIYGGYILFSAFASHSTSIHGIEMSALKFSLDMCYFVILIVLLVFASLIVSLPAPKLLARSNILEESAFGSLMCNPGFLACVFTLFMYVGSEVTIGGFMISYSQKLGIHGMTKEYAADFVSLYWALLLIGRLVGSFILRVMRPRLLVLLCSLFAIVLLGSTFYTAGFTALLAMVLIGLCNSVVFPTVYSLGMKYANDSEITASGILALSVTGGAFIPLLQGHVADLHTLQSSYMVPMACYAIILLYCVFSLGSDSRKV